MSIYFSQFKFLRDRRERIISPALIRYFFLFQYSMDRKVFLSIQSFESLSHVWLFVTPWAVARQASLSITNFRSLLKLMSIESVMPSNHLVLSWPLLLPSVSYSIRIFSSESVLRISGQSIGALVLASVLAVNIQDWFPLGLTGLISLKSKGLSRVFSNTTARKDQFFGSQPLLWYNSHIHTWLLEKPQLWLYRPLLAK